MKLHGHMCLKRTLLWSLSPAIRILDLGRVQKSKHKSLVKTALKYKDAKGVERYKGSKELKGTQFLGFVTFAPGGLKKVDGFDVCGIYFHCPETPALLEMPWPALLGLRLYPVKFVGKIFQNRKLFFETLPHLPGPKDREVGKRLFSTFGILEQVVLNNRRYKNI